MKGSISYERTVMIIIVYTIISSLLLLNKKGGADIAFAFSVILSSITHFLVLLFLFATNIIQRRSIKNISINLLIVFSFLTVFGALLFGGFLF